MGSLGLPEIIFILLLALLIFGPKRLPEIGRTLGKGMSEFRKASNDLKRTINAELALDEDEQTRHPRRIDTPVANIVHAMSGTSSGTPQEPALPHQPYAPYEPASAPVGTIAQVTPVITPAPAVSHDPTAPEPPPPAAPIEPS
ncbi:MAG: sec-independent protein translocase protein TatA [Acidobacteriota bacterium]|jgi:TatA/E family protein of Tat protein translocase|nr:sec-independent protein translocase protein TatA [Acidobacteriota bacterium]